MKSGGVALDGEGKYGPNAPNPRKPWAEKSITLDLFAYHGLTALDNGTGTVAGGTASPALQNDRFNAAGAGPPRAVGLALAHGRRAARAARPPVPGDAAVTINSAAGGTIPGTPDFTNATTVLQYDGLDYIVFPWLVPGVRVEYTQTTFEGASNASLLRVIPGVATLVRPNLRVVVTGDFENASGLPPVGSWGPAGGVVAPTQTTKFQAETINLTANVAF